MRLFTFKPPTNGAAAWRLGVGIGDRIADLGMADDLYREATRASLPDQFSGCFPGTLIELLRLEGPALPYAARIAAWLATQKEPAAQVSWTAEECAFDAPLRPGKLITVARNYHEHVAEHGLVHSGDVPSASIKASSSLSGPYDDIVQPRVEKQLDYETELAVVIGTRCKNVPQRDAHEVVAGYTVLCDVVARQVLKVERAAGNQFLGKMFDTFGPLGPSLVTKDEIADPMNLRLSTTVNGEARQRGNTSAMIWKIPQLIAYFSQATLEPGDIISTGTPAGVAAGRKPHETPWYLNPGDVIECEVESVGRLRNRVVSDPSGPGDWDWKL